MHAHIAKYKTVYISSSSLVKAITLGIYISLFSVKIVNAHNFFHVFILLGTWNLFLVATICFVFFDIWISNASKTLLSENRTILINKILEMACRSLVFPDKNKHIRAIITMCNYNKNIRKTTYSYNIIAAPERTAEYGIFFGVTGQAIKDKTVVAKELTANHKATYTEKEKKLVEPRLQGVLAAPIFSRNNMDNIIGVLAFDSCNDFKTMKFDSYESKEIAQSWADIVSLII